jgi:hypothetical protein
MYRQNHYLIELDSRGAAAKGSGCPAAAMPLGLAVGSRAMSGAGDGYSNAPTLDEDHCLEEGAEDLAVEPLVAQLAVAASTPAVLPRASGLDVKGLNLGPGEPRLDGLGRELVAVGQSNVV